jgi:hypothetical protein
MLRVQRTKELATFHKPEQGQKNGLKRHKNRPEIGAHKNVKRNKKEIKIVTKIVPIEMHWCGIGNFMKNYVALVIL